MPVLRLPVVAASSSRVGLVVGLLLVAGQTAAPASWRRCGAWCPCPSRAREQLALSLALSLAALVVRLLLAVTIVVHLAVLVPPSLQA